jgi:hypothetical protein
MKRFIIILSLCYLIFLACIGGAEFLFHKGMDTKDSRFLQEAQRLNPFSSEYFYGEFRLNHNVKALVHAIRLEPTKAAYHMYYGLALLERVPRTPLTDQEAVVEICQGAQLKPYSPIYRSACESYKSAILVPSSSGGVEIE